MGDVPLWIDACTMLEQQDKTMSSDMLANTVSIGLFDMTPTEISIAIKAKDPKLEIIEKTEPEQLGEVSTDDVRASSMH